MLTQLSSTRKSVQRDDLQTAIAQLIAVTEKHSSRFHNEVLLHAASLQQLRTDVRKGLLTSQETSSERRRITHAILELIDDVDQELDRKSGLSVDTKESEKQVQSVRDVNGEVLRTHSLSDDVDILLVTVTKVETMAILDTAKQQSAQSHQPMFIGHKTYYDLGQIGGARTFLVQSEMGSAGPGGASLTIWEAVETLAPTAVIMVGIAFGVNPEKQQIGDILVSKQLMNYAQQRVSTESSGELVLVPRGDRVSASIRLLDRFRHGELSWTEARVKFGLILSGPKLVDNYDYRRQLQQLEPEAIGGEMEGSGLYDAAHLKKVDWILVKAICDWADGHKHKNKSQYQAIAAQNAADFTIHVLTQGGFA
jgi:nucleoside phosphorylase